jgi:hypothetical protein
VNCGGYTYLEHPAKSQKAATLMIGFQGDKICERRILLSCHLERTGWRVRDKLVRKSLFTIVPVYRIDRLWKRVRFDSPIYAFDLLDVYADLAGYSLFDHFYALLSVRKIVPTVYEITGEDGVIRV